MAQAPCVHLNGTSKSDLLRQQLDSIRDLRKAQETMAQGAPHGRDYYIIDSDATSRAMAEHRARMTAIGDVIAELEVIARLIDEQGGPSARA